MKSHTFSRYIIIALSLGILWLALALLIAPAFAARPGGNDFGATITVNTTTDELNSDGDCSLREAVRSANLDSAVDACTAGNGADLINIPVGTYVLTIAGDNEEAALTGDLDITDEVTIEGVSAADTIISSAVADRIFHVQAGVLATFNNIAIRDGQETVFGGGGLKSESGSKVQITNSWIISNTAPGGGGISNAGTMTITLSVIADNTGSPFTGGAMIASPTGKTTLINSAVNNNEASAGGALSTFNGHFILINSILSNNRATGATDGGGAVRVTGSATIDVINSSLSGNSSVYDGGAIYAFNNAVINLYNATIASNSTSGSGGGLNLITGASVNMLNSILADNTGGSNPDCAATITSLGYNLIENVSANCNVSGDTTGVLSGVDPLFGPLQDNGGPTDTHALLENSPAIDAGNPSGCADLDSQPLTTDQRGFPRPLGDACDLGSFEAEAVIDPPTGGTVFMPIVLAP